MDWIHLTFESTVRVLPPFNVHLFLDFATNHFLVGTIHQGICPSLVCSVRPREGTGLPIRNCAGSSNNLVPKGTKVSAIDLTPKVFFERLCWFEDWAHLSSESPVCGMCVCYHTPTVDQQKISVHFFQMWISFLSAHDSPVIWPCPGTLLLGRVQGLPIRDCAESCNNRRHMRPQLSAKFLTGKIFVERLYLVPGMGTFLPWVKCPYAPTTLTVHITTISWFPCNLNT